MDLYSPEDISPPATPPNFNFSSSSHTPLPTSQSSSSGSNSRPTQRLRTSFNESTNNVNSEFSFDEDQLTHLRQLKQSFQQLSPQQKQFLL